MKNRVIVTAFALALSAVMCGCGAENGNDNSGEQVVPESSTVQTTVSENTATESNAAESIETKSDEAASVSEEQVSEQAIYSATISVQYESHQDGKQTTSTTEDGIPKIMILPETDSTITYTATQLFAESIEEVTGEYDAETTGEASVKLSLPFHYFLAREDGKYMRYDSMEMFGEGTYISEEVDETSSVNLLDLYNCCAEEVIATDAVIQFMANTVLGLYGQKEADLTIYEGQTLPVSVSSADGEMVMSIDLTGLNLEQFYGGIITDGTIEIVINTTEAASVVLPEEARNATAEQKGNE